MYGGSTTNRIDQVDFRLERVFSEDLIRTVHSNTASLQTYWNLRDGIKEEIRRTPIFVWSIIHGDTPHVPLRPMRIEVRGRQV